VSRGAVGGRRPAPPSDPHDVAAASAAALQILNGAAQSSRALAQRLERRGFASEAATAAVAAMREYGYVDDSALAVSIAGRRRREGYGRMRIAADLRARGIENDDLTTTLDSLDAGEDVDVALAAVRRRWPAPFSDDPATREAERRRMAGFLQRRGFGSETVGAVIREHSRET
jgi:regulatory protein